MVRFPKKEIAKIKTTQKHQSHIEVIFFDLGNVILPFNNYQIAEKFSRFSQKREFQDPKEIFSYLFDLEKGVINDFDLGRVSPSQFFQSIRKTLGLSIAFEQFIPIWTDIFIENKEVSEIILSLKGKWRLGLLSNTDPLHFNYIVSTFPIVSVLEKWILSYEVGFKKPDTRIFQKAIEWASVEPDKILFIDDTKGHVEAAVSLGMQGIHFISGSQLRTELTAGL
jgi:putative hydrolase of the HAD superfamily